MSPIVYELDGFPILLHSATQLPHIKQAFPLYGTNVGRLARTVAAAVPDLTILDIGANVGDTVATLRRYCAAPILCVEGCDEYLTLLKENLRQFFDVEIEEGFVGSGEVAAKLVVEKGTAFMEPGEHGGVMTTRPLRQILERHPRFGEGGGARLWKIDTDGWDAFILQNNIEVVGAVRPVVFFEYDPHFFVGKLSGSSGVFEALRGEGYHDVLFWENTGDFHLRTNLGERALIQDLHESVAGRNKSRYWDVAAFPRELGELAGRQRDEEIAVFRKARA
ncbi:MAG TPA: hypothetical protein VM008_10655 [Phycisphaerae bacterium]|nr:hypothetical protein [Phycisphaerae bacterium]